MKRVITVAAILALAYFIYKLWNKQNKYYAYLKALGIPANILHKMNNEEIKAAAKYLLRYGNGTRQHFQVGDADYEILSNIRSKYGIFS